MCGISAVIGNDAVLKALQIVREQEGRGDKGTGVAWIDKNGNLKHIKSISTPTDFLKRVVKNIPMEDKVKIAIAHNRQPSVGDVKRNNTHPFVDCENRFALVHNGTINNGIDVIRTILKLDGHNIRGDTDSEVLTHLLGHFLNKTGKMYDALKNLKEALGTELCTIVVLDKSNNWVWGIANGYLNTLYIKRTKTHIFVMSEPEAFKPFASKTELKKDEAHFDKVKMNEIFCIDKARKLYGKFEDVTEDLTAYSSDYEQQKDCPFKKKGDYQKCKVKNYQKCKFYDYYGCPYNTQRKRWNDKRWDNDNIRYGNPFYADDFDDDGFGYDYEYNKNKKEISKTKDYGTCPYLAKGNFKDCTTKDYTKCNCFIRNGNCPYNDKKWSNKKKRKELKKRLKALRKKSKEKRDKYIKKRTNAKVCPYIHADGACHFKSYNECPYVWFNCPKQYRDPDSYELGMIY